jgi:hypothetical protein
MYKYIYMRSERLVRIHEHSASEINSQFSHQHSPLQCPKNWLGNVARESKTSISSSCMILRDKGNLRETGHVMKTLTKAPIKIGIEFEGRN